MFGELLLIASWSTLLSAGFALNLAYIGLDHFRYKRKIAEFAQHNLDLNLAAADSFIRGLPSYKRIERYTAPLKNEKPEKDTTHTNDYFFDFLFGINKDRYIASTFAFF